MADIEVKPVWDGFNRDQLRAYVTEQTQEALNFYKSIQGKPDLSDRIPYLESKQQNVLAASEYLSKLDSAHTISERLNEQMKSLNEPTGHLPFAKNGGDPQRESENEPSTKSFGESVAQLPAVKSLGEWGQVRQPVSLEIPNYMWQASVKTLMTTTAGFAPANDRTAKLVDYPMRVPRLADLIPVTQTNVRTVYYMEETTAMAGTNAQVSIAEGASKFENTLVFTERAAPVEKVGTYIHVTTEQLDDVAGIQSILNNRINNFLRLKEEDLLLNGTGTTPQLAGFLGAGAPNVLVQDRGTDTNIDAIFKAIQKVRVTGLAEPDAVVMHPDNFTMIALYKATSGEYGFDVTVDNGGVVRLWGKPLIQTAAMTVGTALVGAFGDFSEIYRKMGMTVMVGLNADDFTKNLRTVLGEFREALAIYRQTAFCKVTTLQ